MNHAVSYYRPQRNWDKVIYPQASVILSTGGVCMLAGGRGHAWLRGGMSGCWGCAWLLEGMLVAGGCVWLLGVRGCGGGGMHGCWGACMVAREVCMGYDEIRSMGGRYASYWNAFLCEECVQSCLSTYRGEGVP